MDDRFRLLQHAVEKFLNDTNAIPPWESAGELWALRIKELHGAWLDSNEELESHIKSRRIL